MIRQSVLAREDLTWWLKSFSEWNGRKVCDPSPTMTIETDASKRGWGAACQGIMTGGCWSGQEVSLHINVLEMMAALFAIKAFAKNHQGLSILLLTDMSVVAHVNPMVGTRSPYLVSLTKQMWQWCLHKKITISAQHLPDLQNITADFLSRYLSDRTDCMDVRPCHLSVSQSLSGQLEARSRGGTHGCISAELVRTPTMVPNRPKV